MSDLPSRLPLVQSPTPLHRLDRLSDELRQDVWIKRDDLTGFAFGGNKGRKLEYLMPAVLASGAEIVVTSGAEQSNFIRQLGAACAYVGVRCAAVTMPLPYDVAPAGPSSIGAVGDTGNLLLDKILGVEIERRPDGTWGELARAAEALADKLEAEGRRVYRMPLGGSSPLGAYGFVMAAREVENQAPEGFDRIIFASSSGSTHVGLATAFAGGRTDVLGIACDPEPEIAEDFAELSRSLACVLGNAHWLRTQDFRLDFRFVGPGYGVPSAAGASAIRRLARTEGVFLDPIYSGKAFAALLALAGEGMLGGRTLFWHTGGLPGLFS